MRILWTILVCTLGALPAVAQQTTAVAVGNDAFMGGRTVAFDTEGVDDLFAAGQDVQIRSGISGSAYLAGQDVLLGGPAGGDVHAIGQTVAIMEGVAGDVSATGQDVRILGPVGGDLRVAGSTVEVTAPVTGYAILGGERVTVAARIEGDAVIGAERLQFEEGAQIGGRLTLFEDEVGETAVPASVISEDRITRRELEEWEQHAPNPVPTLGAVVGRFLGGVVMVVLLAALVAALIPHRLAEMRRATLAAPLYTLGVGFLAQSALLGSVFIVAMTLIGLLLVPAILLLAGLTALAGYVVGAYTFGVGLILLVGRGEPDTLGERAIAAAVGALVAGLLALIPFLGWIFVVALSLTGIGAIVGAIRYRRWSAAA
jgi:hypothetical protein